MKNNQPKSDKGTFREASGVDFQIVGKVYLKLSTASESVMGRMNICSIFFNFWMVMQDDAKNDIKKFALPECHIVSYQTDDKFQPKSTIITVENKSYHFSIGDRPK